jgi:RimJ/RimL family protein N-acetyltransferase
LAHSPFWKLTIRKATVNDMREIWHWWNDKTTRDMMKNNEVVGWDTHVYWYHNLLRDQNRTLYIFKNYDNKIGVVRFDRIMGNIFDTSINLNPDHRGKGYGAKMIALGVCKIARDKNSNTCVAAVKIKNPASWKSFIKAGYTISENIIPEDVRLKDFDPQTEYFLKMDTPQS